MKGYLQNSSLLILSSNSKFLKSGWDYLFFFRIKLYVLGINILTNLTFYYQPKSKINIALTSTAIAKFQSNYIIPSLSEMNIQSQYALILEIDFRECLYGEYYRSDLHTYNFALFSSSFYIFFF